MRFILLFTFIFCLSKASNAQTVFADGGMSVSRLSLKLTPSFTGFDDLFNQRVQGYSFNLGLKYRDRKYYNMYSLVGIIKKGGKETVHIHQVDTAYLSDLPELGITKFTVIGELQYLIFSTGVDIKYPVGESFYPYLRIGPRVDYLLEMSNNIEQFIGDQQDELNAVQAGLFLGAGMAYKIRRFEIELKTAYLLNFLKIYERKEPSLSKPSVEFDDRTWIFNLGVSFNLKKKAENSKD
jgi:hypothetical protein